MSEILFKIRSSVQLLSRIWLFATPWTAARQASLSFTISWSLFKLMSNSTESMILSNFHPLWSPSFPAFSLSQHQGLFQWVWCLHQVDKLLELYRQSFQWIFRVHLLYDWLVWSPCCPRDSQESSPTPQFKSINSSVLSLLFGPALTSIHIY